MTKIACILTMDRPVDGVMRLKGETVHLTDAAYADEMRWGGLEPAASRTDAPVPATVAEADEPAAAARTRRKA